MPERKAQAHWEGSVKEGHGWIAVESGVVEAEYSFGSRFENRKRTNPEELLGLLTPDVSRWPWPSG